MLFSVNTSQNLYEHRPKPNRNSAAATKIRKSNKSCESANPIPVLLLSFESQTVVFSLSLSHPLPPPLFPQPPRFLGVELNSLPTYRRALLSERLEQANPNPDLTLTLIAF